MGRSHRHSETRLRRKILAVEVPLKNEKSTRTLGSLARVTSAGGRGVHVTSGSENQRGFSERETEVILLTGLCTDSLNHKFTCSKIQCRGSSAECARDMWRGAKLTAGRGLDGQGSVELFLQTEAMAGTAISL